MSKSEKQYPIDPAGELDAGVERETREHPCTKRTWCIRGQHDDAGDCVVVPRHALPAADFGPAAATRRR